METNNEKDIRIIDLEKSNWRLKIIIGVLIISMLTSFVYAFVRQGIAIEWRRVAVEQEEKSVKVAEEALALGKMAEMSAMEAMRQNQRAEEALRKASKK